MNNSTTLRDVTGEEVKAAVLASGDTFIKLRECSMCRSRIGYHVRDGEAGLDTNCQCVPYTVPIQRVTWDQVADNVNMQDQDVHKRAMAAKFHIDLDQPPKESGQAPTMAERVQKLETALREIQKGEGRFSTDPLEHASNTIDDMKAIATAALLTTPK